MENSFIFKKSSEPSFSVDGADGYNFSIINKNLEIDLIDSKTGHGGKVVSDLMTHIYYVLEGEGDFEIDDVSYHLAAGELVEIPPMHTLNYRGKMKLLLIMNPPFSPEHIKHL